MTLSKDGSSSEARLVVLVLSHNKREHTLRCLESVRQLQYQPRTVVVVDNGSSDGSADAVAAHHPDVHLVRSEVNLGAAGGRNFGIAWAEHHLRYEYILFLDDDTVVRSDLAGVMIRRIGTDRQIGLVTPKAYRSGSADLIASAGGMRVRLGSGSITDIGAGERDSGQFDRSVPVDSCVGFAVLARREALARCAGFDNRFNPYGWEEVDLSLRLRLAGYTIYYEPSAICWHAGGTPGRGRRVLAYERGKILNYLRLMGRHATAAEWAGFLAVLPIRAVRLLTAQFVSYLKTRS